ncbi:hypothetical protein C8R47DRAFT_1157311 [Mycena vitilis]|nr:hypothetical protein C8R47DRAFT_1157311 [Mycena vitilis]
MILNPTTGWSETRAVKYPESKFKEYLGKDSWERVKLLVKKYCKDRDNEYLARVDKAELDNLAKQIPRLSEFEGAWPLQLYLKKYVYWRARRAPSSTTVKHRKVRTTKTRDRVQPCPSHTSEVSASVGVDYSSITGLFHEDRPSGSPQLRPEGNTSQLIPESIFPTACVFCGFQPSIPYLAVAELNKVFSGNSQLQDVLLTGGVRHDHDLFMFLNLSPISRAKFFQADWAAHIPQFQKIQLETVLSSAYTGMEIAMHGFQHYGDFLARLEPLICYTLDLSKPFHHQEPNRVECMIQEIKANISSLADTAYDWVIKTAATQYLAQRKTHTRVAHNCIRKASHADPTTEYAARIRQRGLEDLLPAISLLGITSCDAFRHAVTPSHLIKISNIIRKIGDKNNRQSPMDPHLTPLQSAQLIELFEDGTSWNS